MDIKKEIQDNIGAFLKKVKLLDASDPEMLSISYKLDLFVINVSEKGMCKIVTGTKDYPAGLGTTKHTLCCFNYNYTVFDIMLTSDVKNVISSSPSVVTKSLDDQFKVMCVNIPYKAFRNE